MKIVVLDGHTLNPGDLDWSALRALGDCEIHARTPVEQIGERARGAEAILTTTGAARRRLPGVAVDNLPAFVAGAPQNTVTE